MNRTTETRNIEGSRRNFIKASAAVSMAAGLAAGGIPVSRAASTGTARKKLVKKRPANTTGARKGRIKQSVCKWCYGKIPLENLAAFAASIGLKSIELVGSKDWPILKKHGLICAMSNSHGIGKGLNRKENHAECLEKIRKSIEETAEAGFPNVICFSGNRAGMDDEEGLANCAVALKQVVGLAERKKVTICMELLNSKRNHKDYMCDRTHWGVKLVKSVGSPNLKLLYDIYHMQVQEGDVIDTIEEYKDYIGHYHTAGVPGRHELDDTQELNYAPIVRAIVNANFQGYLGQEFIPKKDSDPLEKLAEAVQLCDV